MTPNVHAPTPPRRVPWSAVDETNDYNRVITAMYPWHVLTVTEKKA